METCGGYVRATVAFVHVGYREQAVKARNVEHTACQANVCRERCDFCIFFSSSPSGMYWTARVTKNWSW